MKSLLFTAIVLLLGAETSALAQQTKPADAKAAETSASTPSPTQAPTATPTPEPTVTPAPTPTATPKKAAHVTLDQSGTPIHANGSAIEPTQDKELIPPPVPADVPDKNANYAGSQTQPVQILELSLDDKNGRAITLEDAIKLAWDGATAILKAQNDTILTGAQLLQAYGQFLPSVIGSADYAYQTGNTYSVVATPTLVNGSNKTAAYGITADLNLFNGLADFANLKSSILKKDASELTLERARETIGLDVAQSFLQVILDTKLVDIAKKNLQASYEREKLLEAQTEVGARNLSDLFRQQAQTSLDESSLLSAENKNRTDQISLLRRVRLDVNKPYQFVDPNFPEDRMVVKPPTEQSLIEEAIKNRADLKASTDVATATHWDINTARSSYFPKLDLVGNISAAGHSISDQTVNGMPVYPATNTSVVGQLGTQVEYTVAITLTWTLFDRFLTHENISRAQITADNSDIDQENRRLQVQGEVRQSYGDYLTAIQQLRSSKKGLVAAQKAYEVMEGRYSVGAASFLDLITSQSTLVQAESTRAQAVINYELQTKALGVATGRNPASNDKGFF